jgi:hypothetical protein
VAEHRALRARVSAPAAPAAAPHREPAAKPADGRPSAQPPSARDPGDAFDAIFSEVQGLVFDTLKSSVKESLRAAHAAEAEISAVPPVPRDGVPVAQPVSESVSGPASEPVSEAIERDGRPITEGAAKRLARPRDDEEADEDDAPAPAGPYDWGVRPARKPKGAWLLDTSEEPPGDDAGPPAEPISDSQSPAAPPARARPAAPAGGGGGQVGPRNYLVRKAAAEVKRMAPVVETLRRKGVLTREEARAERNAASPQAEDEVSVDSYKDERPRGEDIEKELSPMRLVEELRRLRRVTDALVRKGVITKDDLAKAADD